MRWKDELNSKRRADGWYGCIAPDGWEKIVLETDEMLAHIDPDYEIHQIKEKFGTLRYYFGSKYAFNSIEGKIMNAITRSAEMRSSGTCEICGKWGELDDSQYYIRTLCEEHRMDKDESLNDDDYEIPIKYIEEDDWEPHPPQGFRDKSNGE